MKAIFSALRTCQQCRIAHLDVKPGNIFIRNEKFKLGDFGLATRFDAASFDIPEGTAIY